jgi:hypothetical protein
LISHQQHSRQQITDVFGDLLFFVSCGSFNSGSYIGSSELYDILKVFVGAIIFYLLGGLSDSRNPSECCHKSDFVAEKTDARLIVIGFLIGTMVALHRTHGGIPWQKNPMQRAT